LLRTLFAAERTFLAWIRTGLALMGFGFLIERFGLFLREVAVLERDALERPPRVSLWLGTLMILLGVAVNVFGAVEHLRRLRDLDPAALWTRRGARAGAALSFLLAAIGVVLAFYLHAWR
jgi:putative membrane protein